MTASATLEDRARVYFDANAGGWCYQLPGRQPVQAEDWAAAWTAVYAELWPAPAPPLVSAAATERSWLARLLCGGERARNQGDY